MTLKTSKAPPVGDRGALGDVVHGQAINVFEDTTSTRIVQEKWIARRFGLNADRAHLVAALAFERRATV